MTWHQAYPDAFLMELSQHIIIAHTWWALLFGAMGTHTPSNQPVFVEAALRSMLNTLRKPLTLVSEDLIFNFQS